MRATLKPLEFAQWQYLVLAFCTLICLFPQPAIAATNLVIAEVYGGAGSGGANYKNDFVVVFNPTASDVDVNGWSIQYASSAGSTWAATSLATGSKIIPPGKYFLVQEALGAGGTIDLTTPDATGNIAMSGTAGKVALCNSTNILTGSCPTGGSIIDFVGYGTANCSEGSPAPTPSSTTSDQRKDLGCFDTYNNFGDFSAGAPNPRNSASPAHLCVANDTCDGAIVMNTNIVYTMNTINATSTGDPIPICEDNMGRGVWYSFTPSVSGFVIVSTCGSDFDTVVQVHTGNCGSLNSDDCNDDFGPACEGFQASISFNGTAGTVYRILAGGRNGAGGNLSIVATLCQAPVFAGMSSFSILETNGVRVFYQASFSGTPPFSYSWDFSDGFFTNSSSDTISRVYGPFDPFPANLNVSVINACGGNGGGGGIAPPCGAICLSVGVPSTRTGTDGSNTNCALASSCGTFPAGSKWFRMSVLTNGPGIATVSTEGSTYNTVLGVYRGSISNPCNLTNVICNASNNQSRVEFETRPNTNYWLVVNGTNNGILKLTYGYELKIASLVFNKTNRTVDLRSAPLPSLKFQLQASTNLPFTPANSIVLQNTNFTANTSVSNNVLRFVDTNVLDFSRRFYRIMLVP